MPAKAGKGGKMLSRKNLMITIISVLCLVSSVGAGEIKFKEPDTTYYLFTRIWQQEVFRRGSLGGIDYWQRIGWLSPDSAILYKAYALFDTLKLPKIPDIPWGKAPIRCGTAVVDEIKERWMSLPSGIKQELLNYFSYYPGDTTKIILDLPPVEWLVWQASNRFVFRYVLEGEHAIDPTDNNHNGVPDYLDELFAKFNIAWQKEIVEYGYKAIPNNLLPIRIYVYHVPVNLTEHMGDSILIHLENHAEDWGRKILTAHEFFHAIQKACYDMAEARWWMEGTAEWMEDEVWDEINDYVRYIANYVDHPEWSLNDINILHGYGTVTFAKLMAERRGVNIIRSIWDNCKNPPGDNSIEAITKGLGNLSEMQSFFKTFVCANYIRTGKDGYSDDAAPMYPEPEKAYTYLPDHNQHYANRPPSNIGDPVPWEEGNFPNGSPIWLPHLACHYIRVVKPVQIDNKTMLYFNFEGSGDKLIWALPYVKVKKDKSLEKGEIILNNNKAYNYPIPIGGEDQSDIAEIVFIPTNLDTSGNEVAYRYSFAIVPVFQKSYQENPKNGSTREVLNLDPDNWYKPKDKVRLKVDLSDRVHIGNKSTLTADFSQVDKAFDPSKVTVTEVNPERHEYQIEYELSNTLAEPNQLLPVIIRVKDLTNDPNHQPKETIFQLRVEGPPVIEFTDPSDGASEVDVYKNIIITLRW
jgi:hypothetical protein